MSILDVLLSKGVVAKADIPNIRKEITTSGQTLEAILLKRGVNSRDILTAKGEFLGIPTINLDNQTIPNEVLKFVPEESALYYQFVPISVKEGVLEVGIVDPD